MGPDDCCAFTEALLALAEREVAPRLTQWPRRAGVVVAGAIDSAGG